MHSVTDLNTDMVAPIEYDQYKRLEDKIGGESNIQRKFTFEQAAIIVRKLTIESRGAAAPFHPRGYAAGAFPGYGDGLRVE